LIAMIRPSETTMSEPKHAITTVNTRNFDFTKSLCGLGPLAIQ
jgi:hypothetical protein